MSGNFLVSSIFLEQENKNLLHNIFIKNHNGLRSAYNELTGPVLVRIMLYALCSL